MINKLNRIDKVLIFMTICFYYVFEFNKRMIGRVPENWEEWKEVLK